MRDGEGERKVGKEGEREGKVSNRHQLVHGEQLLVGGITALWRREGGKGSGERSLKGRESGEGRRREEGRRRKTKG